MHYVKIDLHKHTMVVAVDDNEGPVGKACSYACQDVAAIKEYMERLRPFRGAIEASSSYRWLHQLLSPLGEVMLAHQRRLRAITDGRAKTDNLYAALLAKLLRPV